MRWSSQKPQACGYYWYRVDAQHDRGNIVHVQVWQHFGGPDYYIMLGMKPIRVNEIDGEWSGPIERPKS
jgi:hypothetical protein